eukprot:jgi/Botrbrau1/6542/Bobra.40_2s0013.1
MPETNSLPTGPISGCEITMKQLGIFRSPMPVTAQPSISTSPFFPPSHLSIAIGIFLLIASSASLP